MTTPAQNADPLPPRLTMDEYADVFEEALRDADQRLVNRQKELEERIEARFRISDEAPARRP